MAVNGTMRIQGIPIDTTADQLLELFKAKGFSLIEEHGDLLFVSNKHRKDTKMTTVSFADNQTDVANMRRLSTTEQRLYNRLTFDSEFEGLTILTEGTVNENRMDIVALHGMNGHAFRSWEYSNEGRRFMWLRDHLPLILPNARVILYGYNANLDSDGSEGRIHSFAERFLEDLHGVRKKVEPQRPLILLGQCLGGLVIKDALLSACDEPEERFRSILDNVRGIFFIGTPHRGLNLADAGVSLSEEEFTRKFVAAEDSEEMSKEVIVVARTFLLEQKRDNNLLFDLTTKFRGLIAKKGISIATAHESRKTKLGGSPEMSIWIVDEQSAKLGVVNERKSSIEADHINLGKFKAPEDRGLEWIISTIEEFGVSVDSTQRTSKDAHSESTPPSYEAPTSSQVDSGGKMPIARGTSGRSWKDYV